jgi:predicted oxidoreductase
MRKKVHPEGPELSAISAGLWRLHEWKMTVDERIEFIQCCIDHGVTTFDHADIYGEYGNEALFGEALKARPDLRDKIELVSKCGICLTTPNRPDYKIQHYNTTAGYIRYCVESSLEKLHCDFLDLILIHRPDPLMDASEMADLFMQLIGEGKIKFVGVSNFTPSQFKLLQSRLDVPLVTNQVEYSLLHTKPLFDGTFDQAQELSFSPMIWSPFAGGRFFHEESEQAQRVRHLCYDLARKYSASIDQISLAWLMMHPCSPIPVIGTGKTDRIESMAKATHLNLDRQDWFRLLETSRGHGVA